MGKVGVEMRGRLGVRTSSVHPLSITLLLQRSVSSISILDGQSFICSRVATLTRSRIQTVVQVYDV